jgi:hypothetical protein
MASFFTALIFTGWSSRSVPKLGRSKSEMSSATSLAAGTFADRPNIHLSPTLNGGWDCSVASAWRAVSLAGISLLVETSSLFLITGNLSLRLRKGFGISALDPPGGSSFEGFPCSFPVDQGNDSRDEFAPDCLHRHLVHDCGESSSGARAPGKIRAIPRGFGGAAKRGGTGDSW